LRRNLVLLDLLVAALCGLAFWRFSAHRHERLAEQKTFLERRETPLPTPVVLIPPPPPPAVAGSYVELAQKLLLSADRNPTVVIEVVAPRIMPALPRAYGLMDMGNGAHVFLALTPGSPQHSYVKGDTIGEFKLLEISRAGLVFGWEDKQVAARFDELKDAAATRTAAEQAAAPNRSARQAVQPAKSLETPPARPAEPQRLASDESAQGQPGGDPNAPTRPCMTGDKSPEGTISGGYRKIIVYTPMGNSCGWSKVH
jgi:cell division septation protein DedD